VVKSGDIVEIITSPQQKPGKDWINFVTTSKARNKIRSYLRSEQRERSKLVGKELMEQECAALGLDYDKLLKTGEFEPLAKMVKEGSFDDVIVAVGYGKLNPRELLGKLFPSRVRAEAAEPRKDAPTDKPRPQSSGK